jgi:phosphoserine phosphatase
MTYVATFISHPARAALNDETLRRLMQCLPGVQSFQWLDDGVAADVIFDLPSAPDDHALRQTLHAALDGLPIDFFAQPLAARRKKLLIADMDSTMVGQECIDELADFIGQKIQVAAITERAMRGEIAFEPALRERVALLRGLSVDVVAEVLTKRITLTPGAKTLVQTMRAQGAYTVLVSGGFTLFASEIAGMIGFHAHRANVLIVEDGKLSGRVGEPILGKAAKLDALEHFRALHKLSASETLAVGDGANDLAMLQHAGLGVAFHAKLAVAVAAHARVDHSDLTALLYAQGFGRAEFIQ